jgi:hypothetical protein
MKQNAGGTLVAHDRGETRLSGIALTLVLSAGLALGAVSCAGGPARPASSASGVTADGGAGDGSGPVTIPGRAAAGGSGQRTAGAYTLAFARCMRAHGIPAFPDPDGGTGHLGPGSGIDPASPRFQAALNGPCKSLAPIGWISSGSGTVTR